MNETAAFFGVVAMARFASAVICCPAAQIMYLPVCGDHAGRVPIPLKRGKVPGDDQPAGCHAVCGRKCGGDCPED